VPRPGSLRSGRVRRRRTAVINSAATAAAHRTIAPANGRLTMSEHLRRQVPLRCLRFVEGAVPSDGRAWATEQESQHGCCTRARSGGIHSPGRAGTSTVPLRARATPRLELAGCRVVAELQALLRRPRARPPGSEAPVNAGFRGGGEGSELLASDSARRCPGGSFRGICAPTRTHADKRGLHVAASTYAGA
jgi:hypothetical protein